MNTLFTIGYQQSDITSVLDVLRENGVETVIDVRALPVSRKPGFSKGSLARALDEHGIAYVHERALGTPPEARDAHKARQFDTFHALYERHLQSGDAAAGLDRVAERAAQGPCCRGHRHQGSGCVRPARRRRRAARCNAPRTSRGGS